MSDLPAFDPAVAASFLTARAHNGWLGLTYCKHGSDWVELELPWREDLIGQDGEDVLASGPIISLMDMASGLAIWNRKQEFTAIATLDLRVDYIRPARARSSVFGNSQCYRLTKSAAFVRGYAHDGDPDDPVARMLGVFMTIKSNQKMPSNGPSGGVSDA